MSRKKWTREISKALSTVLYLKRKTEDTNL